MLVVQTFMYGLLAVMLVVGGPGLLPDDFALPSTLLYNYIGFTCVCLCLFTMLLLTLLIM